MYCRNCGKEIDEKAVVCVHCGVPPKAEKKFCQNCSEHTEANQVVCTKCGVQLSGIKAEKSRVAAGLFAILLGGFGVHKFYLGYTAEAIITLAIIWLGSFLIFPPLIMLVIVIIEGIIYLTMSDEEFREKYIENKKGWF